MSEQGKVVGFDKLDRKLRHPDWAARPVALVLDKWRFATERATKGNMVRGIGGWVDTGHDRRSVTSERDPSAFPEWARVGSNSPKIAFGEFGTAKFSEDRAATAGWRFPTGAELVPWARRHKLNPFAVARSIRARGGLKPRRFLRDADRETRRRIPGWVAQAARQMEAEAGRGA